MDLKEQQALGGAIDDHWYYAAKLRMVEAHIGTATTAILDVGAGAGWFSRNLLDHGKAGSALCIDPGYATETDETVNGRPLSFRRSVDAPQADLVLLMDVLEHVENDVALLAEYVAKARPGTRFLITVPAFEALWSAHDDYLGHYRRYTIKRLRGVVAAAGLTELRAHYYFAAILPAVALVRLLRRRAKPDRSDMAPAPRWVSAVLKAVLGLELRFAGANRIGGLTVVCLCRK